VSEVPIYFRHRVVGKVVKDTYVTKRKKGHVFHNLPCKVHFKCDGLTVSKEILDRLKDMGVVFVKVLLEDGREYVTSLRKLYEEGVETLNDRGEIQLGLPLHDWLKLR